MGGEDSVRVWAGLSWHWAQTGQEEQVTLEAERPDRRSSRDDGDNCETGKGMMALDTEQVGLVD